LGFGIQPSEFLKLSCGIHPLEFLKLGFGSGFVYASGSGLSSAPPCASACNQYCLHAKDPKNSRMVIVSWKKSQRASPSSKGFGVRLRITSTGVGLRNLVKHWALEAHFHLQAFRLAYAGFGTKEHCQSSLLEFRRIGFQISWNG